MNPSSTLQVAKEAEEWSVCWHIQFPWPYQGYYLLRNWQLWCSHLPPMTQKCLRFWPFCSINWSNRNLPEITSMGDTQYAMKRRLNTQQLLTRPLITTWHFRQKKVVPFACFFRTLIFRVRASTCFRKELGLCATFFTPCDDYTGLNYQSLILDGNFAWVICSLFSSIA
jgi:hypothetical protein